MSAPVLSHSSSIDRVCSLILSSLVRFHGCPADVTPIFTSVTACGRVHVCGLSPCPLPLSISSDYIQSGYTFFLPEWGSYPFLHPFSSPPPLGCQLWVQGSRLKSVTGLLASWVYLIWETPFLVIRSKGKLYPLFALADYLDSERLCTP